MQIKISLSYQPVEAAVELKNYDYADSYALTIVILKLKLVGEF